MLRPYESPDDRSIWASVLDALFYLGCLVMLVISSLSHNVTATIVFATFLVLDHLREIGREQKAARHLAERTHLGIRRVSR